MITKITEFKYDNGRIGFLATEDKREFALTNNVDGIELDCIILRTFGDTKQIATELGEKLIRELSYAPLKTIDIGFETAVVLSPVSE